MDRYLCLRVADAVREQIEAGILRPGDKLPARAELAALLLLRRSYSWSIGMDFRSRIWVASFAGNRIRRDTPLTLFDALALAAQAPTPGI
jgi:DNA-binding transcriptional MocR family regulator